jgi:hypothetical protein
MLLAAACAKEEIVYIDPREDEDASHGGYRPFAKSKHGLVHPDGHHEPPEEAIEIGPPPDPDHTTPYAPFAATGGPLVHNAAEGHVVSTVRLAHEGPAPATVAKAGPTSTPTLVPSNASRAVASSGGPAAPAKPSGAPATGLQPAASPTAVARIEHPAGSEPAAKPATSKPESPKPSTSNVPSMDVDDKDDIDTIMGKIEAVVGPTLTLETAEGKAKMTLKDNAKVERDARGSVADLKPGQYVGVLQMPNGPATLIRLYATGPSMPRPGTVPVAGSRLGEIMTFGTIVTLQFGGLLLNASSQTVTIGLPNGIEVLKPAPSAPSDLAVGGNVIATGPVSDDGTLSAMAVRLVAARRD